MNEFDDQFKENSQPNTHIQHDPEIFKHQIEVFEKQILNENLEERFNAWLSYINYSKQFSAAELKSEQVNLQTLYNRCLDKCKGFLKEKPIDERYTRVFVQYTIKYDVRPLKMFEWGFKHQLGEYQSFFYVEWANMLVKQQHFDKAIEMLKAAIEKKALPIEDLKQHLENIKNSKKLYEEANPSENSKIPNPSVPKINETKESNENKPRVKRFAFLYDIIKPNEITGEELSFEEFRAAAHYKAHEEALKHKAKFEAQYLNEIKELKSQVAQLQGQLDEPRPEKPSRLNKARDSIMLPRVKHSLICDESKLDPGSVTMDNLTNVTNFSTWVHETKCQNIDENETIRIDNDSNDTKLKMLNETEDITIGFSRFNEKSSMFNERSIDMLQPPSKKSNLTILGDETSNATLYNGGVVGNSMMTSCYPTPSNKTHSETRNLIDNVFNQTDTIYNKSETAQNNTQEVGTSSIFVYQDYEETMNFKMPEQAAKDFSVFVDNSLNDKTVEIQMKKKYNDGSLFIYPSSADNSLDGKRKPLRSLSDRDSERSNSPIISGDSSDIDFDPPMMASTCNFKQLKAKMKPQQNELDFEPPSSSTCDFKNFRAQKETHERLLETILDETDVNISNADLEKEKLLTKFLGNITEVPKDSPAEKNSNLSKILDEECTKNFKSGSLVKNTSHLLENTGSTVISSVKSLSWDNLNFETDQSAEITAINENFTFSLQQSPASKHPEKWKNATVFELLTQENMDKTFNNEYYKICMGPDFDMTTAPTQNFTQLDHRKLAQEQISEFNFVENNESIAIQPNVTSKIDEPLCLEVTLQTLSKEKLMAEKALDCLEVTEQVTKTNKTNLIEDEITQNVSTTDKITKSHIDFPTLNASSMDTSSLNCSSYTSTTKDMNNTIMHAQRNPFDTEIKNRLLKRRAAVLSNKSYFKNLITQHPIIKEKHFVTLTNCETYTLIEMIGKGAFAKIFLIENKDKEKAKKSKKMALKVDTNATAWEFYITESIHERLEQMRSNGELKINVSRSFIKMNQFIRYTNGCFSAMEYFNNGSLLDLINYHVEKQEIFPYWFVLYLTIEMLYILDYLHKCKIIHADIKPDNFLVNKLPNAIEYFEPNRTKCLVLIDFNRSIDMAMFPEESEFDAKAANKSLLCPEMKSNKTWNYQVDFFGILSCIHCIIFKKFINVHPSKEKNSITSSIPRNYDKLFSNIFREFLNIPDSNSIPDIRNDWIPTLVNLFKMELGTSFAKYSKYLKELNQAVLRPKKNK